MDRTRLSAFVVTVCALLAFAAGAGGACTSQQQQRARQVFEIADQGCAVLKAAGVSDPRLDGVCLTQDELKIALEAVLRAREAAAAVVSGRPAPPPAVSSSAPRAPSSAPSAPPAASSR